MFKEISNIMKIKKIGILTSGGDCSGLNAAIRAVFKRASNHYGIEVYGIIEGTVGLLERPLNYIKLTEDLCGVDMLMKGGTMLGTINKGDPFKFPMKDGTFKDRSFEIVDGYKELGLDGLIAIGGDGSMKIIEKITSLGNIPFIGIPKTIDNDVAFTDFSIGYMTALDVAIQNIQRIHDTALSHRRVMIVECMGRDVGHIALGAGIAGGADVILIPEIPYDMKNVADKILEVYKSGRKYAVIVCAEAAFPKGGEQYFSATIDNTKKYGGVAYKIGAEIEKLTSIETRVTVLGHTQRGGSPVVIDRLMASAFGVKAVDLLCSGANGRVVGWRSGKVIDISLEEVVKSYAPVDVKGDLVATAKGLGISFGE